MDSNALKPRDEFNTYEIASVGPGPLGPVGGAPLAPTASLPRLMWRRKWTVLLSLVGCLAGATAYLAHATPIYRSTARIYVEQTGPRIVYFEKGAMTQSKNYLYTQAEIVKAVPVLAAASESLKQENLRTFAENGDAVGYLKQKATVRVGKKDELLSVSVDSPYPEDAAKLTNAVVNAYVDYHARYIQSTAGEIRKILLREKKKQDEEVAQKLKEMLEYKQVHSTTLLEDQLGNNVMAENLASLSKSLTASRLKTIEKKAGYDAIKSIATNPTKTREFAEGHRTSGNATTDETVKLRTEMKDLTLQLLEWRTSCSKDHPVVRGLEEKIAKLEEFLAQRDQEIIAAELTVAQKEQEAAQQQQAEIQAYFETEQQKTLSLNTQLAQYTLLRSGWEQAKRLADLLEERIKEIDFSDDGGALNINVVEAGTVPRAPQSPNHVRVLGVGVAAGLALAAGLCLLLETTNRRLRSSEEVAAALGVPVVGVVPAMSKRLTVVSRGQRALQDPTSAVAEACRNIRTAVYFCRPNGHARTLLVTSLRAGDGKSTLVSNLAISMAQSGQRTLIIDADFRRPTQHHIFQLPADRNLSGALTGELPLEQAIHTTGVENLDVLPCGSRPQDPAGLLHNKSFRDLLKRLSELYDCIVIDSPPAVPLSDARVLGAMCDMTLLVLRANTATRDQAGQARDGLLSVGASILGSVVNAVPRRNGQYGYGYFNVYSYRRWGSEFRYGGEMPGGTHPVRRVLTEGPGSV